MRATEPIAAGKWQHVAVTYDGSSRAADLRLFIDGREAPTKMLRDRIHKSAATKAYSDGNFTLGQRFRDRGFKDGDIDELRVFERALQHRRAEGVLRSETVQYPDPLAGARGLVRAANHRLRL